MLYENKYNSFIFYFFLQQSSQNYEDHDSYMEIDASPYSKDSKDGMTKGNILLFVEKIIIKLILLFKVQAKNNSFCIYA